MDNKLLLSNICLIMLAMGSLLLLASHNASGQMQTGMLKHKDGNVYTFKTMPDGKQWMTTNLKINIPESYCYENSSQKCSVYGRLYSWRAAQEGCKLLGEGWRLPTNEEWLELARQYGGVFGDSKDSGRMAFKTLLYDRIVGFNAVLGGGRSLDKDQYARGGGHGFYWTATESDTANAWFLNFGKGSQKLFIQRDGEKPWAISARCIRDARDKDQQE